MGSMLKLPPSRVKKEGGGRVLPRSPESWVCIEYTVTLGRSSASQPSLPKGGVRPPRASGAHSISPASTQATKQINAAANLFLQSTCY